MHAKVRIAQNPGRKHGTNPRVLTWNQRQRNAVDDEYKSNASNIDSVK
jgi:hypothetical protein